MSAGTSNVLDLDLDLDLDLAPKVPPVSRWLLLRCRHPLALGGLGRLQGSPSPRLGAGGAGDANGGASTGTWERRAYRGDGGSSCIGSSCPDIWIDQSR